MKVFIGIDNGVTGSIGILYNHTSVMIRTPVFVQQSYTKKKQNISRIKTGDLKDFFLIHTEWCMPSDVFVGIERPMINSARFKSSVSAARALEATLIIVEDMGFGYKYIDSKEWQKDLLPQGLKGTPELKRASMDIGIRTYPHLKEIIEKQEDADGLLIAHYLKQTI